MTTAQPLLDRVRAAFDGEGPVREVRMFGGISFMVADAMVVAVGRDRMLVRVDPARNAELTSRPGARRAEMGTGRDMGDGWIHVEVDALESADELRFWLDVALDHHRSQRSGSR